MKFVSIVAAIVLALASPLPGLAQPISFAPPPAIVMGNHDACHDPIPTGHFARSAVIGASGNTTGVTALMRISTFANFVTCSTLAGNDAASAWIGIMPGPGNPEADNSNALIQVGIVRCNSFLYSACTNNAPHFFWASGGCGAGFPVPQNLGEADTSQHTYKITKRTASSFGIYIDGALKKEILYDDANVSCWVNSYKAAQTTGETLDGGDELATPAGGVVMFGNTKIYDGGWIAYQPYCTTSTPAAWPHALRCSSSFVFGIGQMNVWND